MSRSHHYHGSSTGDDVSFIVIILLACSLCAHKVLVTKVEHYVLLTWLIGGSLFAAIVIYKVFNKLLSIRRRANPDMSDVDTMSGIEFEHYVAKLLSAQGYGAVRLTEEYDYGLDIIAVKDGITWGIQVKRYSGLVKVNAVRQVVTAIKHYHCDRAMVISNSFYSNVAVELARSNDCMLVDRNKLCQWLYSRGGENANILS